MLLDQDLSTLEPLFDLIPDGVLVVDAQGLILLANAGIERIFGYPRDDLHHHPLSRLIPNDEHSKHQQYIREFLSRPAPLYMGIGREVRGVRQDGSPVLVEVGLQPTRCARGPLVVATVVDVGTRRARSEAHQQAQTAFQRLADHAPVVLWVTDHQGSCQFVSHGWRLLTGQAEDEAVGLGWLAMVHPEDQASLQTTLGTARQQQQRFSLDHRLRDVDKGYRWVIDAGHPIHDERGQLQGYVGAIIDIDERKQAEKALRQSQYELRQIIDLVPHAIFLKDLEGRYLLLNEAEAKIHGSSVEAMLGRRQQEFYHNPQELQRFLHEDQEVIRSGRKLFLAEETITLHSGQQCIQQTTKVPLRSPEGAVKAVLGVAIDITAHKRAEARNDYLAYHDHLTGLANRQLLLDRLPRAIAAARQQGSSLALLLLDLDNFRDVNDSLGHPGGDELLVAVGRRLQDLLDPTDSLARLNGDEFAILLEQLSDPAAVQSLAQQCSQAIARPFRIASQNVHITASIGIALFPGHGDDHRALLWHAELALYRAKAIHRGHSLIFSPEMVAEVRQRRNLESQLRQALEAHELTLHFQPQLDLHSTMITSVEALARWPHRDLGMIPPGRFIPVAESSGLIIPLGNWVLDSACRQARHWQQQGRPLRMAVNLSLAQLRQEDFQERVVQLLEHHQLDAELLELEITESLFMDASMPSITTALERLSALGVHLSLDDFGTGYSSLGYLKRFPVERIKMDQSFVRDLGTDPEDRAIAEAILALGERLGKRVLAEGVETPEQLAFLCTRSCDEVQGYLIARPQPAQQLEALLKDWPQRWQQLKSP